MKRFLFVTVVSLLAAKAYAAPPVILSPIKDYGTPVTVAISSTTLTKVPTSQTSGRVEVYVSNASTRPVTGFFGNCTSTALASTIRPIRIVNDTTEQGSKVFPIREDVCLWLISTETVTDSQSIHYQEVIK